MPVDPRLPARAVLALVAAGLAVLLVGVGAALALTHPPGAEDFPEVELGFAVAFAGLALAGAASARAEPRNPVGPVLALAALAFVLPVAAGEYAVHALPGGRDWPLADTAAWLSAWPVPIAYALLLVGLPVLFPTGRVPARWRAGGLLVATAAVLAAGALAVRPGTLDGLVEVDNPYGVRAVGPVADAVAGAAPPLVAAAALVALVGMALRARRASGTERAQFRVLGLALGVLVSALLLQAALGAGESDGLLSGVRVIGFLAVPAALGVAMTRHRLYDVDRFVDRALVYGVVSAGVVVLYVCAVALLSGALGSRVDLGASALAAVMAAVLFPLLRDGVQRLVARRLYGWRDDPYVVLSSLTGRLEGLQPTRVLDGAVTELGAALRLPWVAVRDVTGDLLASTGTPAAAASHVALPLSWQGTSVGTLEVAPRAGERRLPDRDRRLLADAAGQLAGAVRSADLAAALQASRERLVRAREEERRRLRRDLHDGLGPVLTGVALGLDGVAALVPRDPEAAVALARKVRGDAESAVAEVRRVVHDLRPPALDQLGLVPALTQRADALTTATTRMEVTAQALPPLDAAVEVACYAVAVEAMTNVSRHAGATRCRVALSVGDGRLLLEVDDDGSGRHGSPGVGTASSRERAAELGGDVDVVAVPGEGTTVRLSLPLVPA